MMLIIAGGLLALALLQYVVRPVLAMRFYTQQGAASLGYFPFLGVFARCLSAIKSSKDIFSIYKQLGQTKPKPDMAVSNLLHLPALYLLNEELIKEFISKSQYYQRSLTGMDHIEVLFGPGIIIANGQNWKRRRMVLSSLFKFDTVRDLVPSLLAKSSAEIKEVGASGRLNVMPVAERVSVQNIMGFIFGYEKDVLELVRQGTSLVNQIYPYLESLIKSPLFLILQRRFFTWRVNSTSRSMMDLSAQLRQVAHRLMALTEDKLKKGQPINSMIANYMREVEDSKFTREEMIDDVLHLFLAGKDTTSSVITLASYYLCAYPQCAVKVRAELEAGPFPQDLDGLERLTYLNNFVCQVLRHSGFPGTLLYRVALEDHQLCGVAIKKGTNVTPLIVANFFDPEIYPEPQEFRPQRFEDERQKSLIGTSMYYLPFGAGSRSCLGRQLALSSIKAFLVNLVSQFNFRLPDNYDYVLSFSKSICPQEPVDLIVTPRQE